MKNTLAFLLSMVVSFQGLPQSWSNHDFELSTAGAYSTSSGVSGWTISSQSFTSCTTNTVWTAGSPEFSVLSTPLINEPVIGTIPNSPMGGSKIIRMNDASPGALKTRLAKTFTVTSLCTYLTFAYAAVFEDGSHQCCEQAGFRILVRDCQGNLVSCPSFTFGGAGCSFIPSYSLTSGTYWSNWRTNGFVLDQFMNSCFTVEFITNDCIYGDHRASVYLDVNIGVCNWLDCCMYFYPPTAVTTSYCPGSSNAIISAPIGYGHYLWQTSPSSLSSSQATLSSITVTNPVSGTNYSLSMISGNSCIAHTVITLSTTSAQVTNIGSSPSCSMGAGGSATALGGGSNLGYAYTWYNNSGLIGSNQVLSNVPPGIYTVQVTAAGSASSTCGTGSATVSVNSAPAFTNTIKPFCAGQSAYLGVAGTASNVQWYAGTSPITASLGGTSNSLVVSSPVNGGVYYVGYNSTLGCRDSIKYTLVTTTSGSMSITNNVPTCAGTQSGTAVISVTPSLGSPPFKHYYVVSTGTTPTFSLAQTSPGNYTLSNLSAPGTYSVMSFDGNCAYSSTFAVNTITPPSFPVYPSASLSLCNGTSTVAGLSGNPSTSLYNFTWTPATWMFPGTTSLSSVILTPTTAPGTSATVVYTIMASQKNVNCASSLTMAVTVSHPTVLSIVSPGQVCSNAPQMTLTSLPSGGYYINSSQVNAISSAGILTPSLAPSGINNYTYAYTMNNCVATAVSDYTILPAPTLTITGSNNICTGQAATLTASGALSYQWHGLGQQPVEVVAPATSTSYTVTGTSQHNCSSEKTFVVNVVPLPTLSVSGSQSVCAGNTTTLAATGAQSYSWSSGGTAPSQTFAPQLTGSYTLTGINNPGSCSVQTVIAINVLPLPAINVSGSDTVCAGDLVLLNANGALFYKWDGVQGGSSFTTIASASHQFTVSGTDLSGCTSHSIHPLRVESCTGISATLAQKLVKVYPNPTSGELYIQLDEPAMVTIHDTGGQLICNHALQKGSHLIDMSALSIGTYLLQARWKDGVTIQKVIRKD